MLMNFPENLWSEKHARTLDAAATLTCAPLAMFGAMPPAVAQAVPVNSTTTNRSEGSATAQWNAAIAEKMQANDWTKQQAATSVAREDPELRQRYIDEYRQQAARR